MNHNFSGIVKVNNTKPISTNGSDGVFDVFSRDIFFRQIATFIKVCVAFDFGLQTLWLIDFSKIYRLKGLEPKNKSYTNF